MGEHAAVVESVDTLDSKSGVRTDVPVQVRLAVPVAIKKPAFQQVLFV